MPRLTWEERMGRSLEALEGAVWPAPDFDSSVVTRVHQLRKVPLGGLGVEDLRLLIGQKVGLGLLLPLALDVLEEEPFASGDFYPGDLLFAVTRSLTEAGAWSADAELGRRLRRIVERAMPRLRAMEAPELLERALHAALAQLR